MTPRPHTQPLSCESPKSVLGALAAYGIATTALLAWGLHGPVTWLRLTAIAPHFLAGGIVVLLAHELLAGREGSGGRAGPAVAGILYAIHPLQFEAGPFPATPAAFIDAALYLGVLTLLARWMRGASGPIGYVASVAFMAVGAVLASTMVTLPVVAAAWLLIDAPRRFVRRLPALAPHAAVAAVAALLPIETASAAHGGAPFGANLATLLWQWLALGPWLVLSFNGLSLAFIVLGTVIAWALVHGRRRRVVLMGAALGTLYCLPALHELAVPGGVLSAVNASVPIAGAGVALAWALPRAQLGAVPAVKSKKAAT